MVRKRRFPRGAALSDLQRAVPQRGRACAVAAASRAPSIPSGEAHDARDAYGSCAARGGHWRAPRSSTARGFFLEALLATTTYETFLGLMMTEARRVKDKRDAKLDTIDEDEEKSGHK